MRVHLAGMSLVIVSALTAQAPGKFPPDSLINTQVLAKGTPMAQVIGAMRNFSIGLDVRCQYCHVGREGQPLDQFDFASDEKREKRIAREMLRMVQDINRRLDSLPQRGTPHVRVTCATCHRGLSRPVALATVIADAAIASGADSALRAYRALRARYHGSDTYDFTEGSLNTAAQLIARAGKIPDALAILDTNEALFPNSTVMYTLRGTILLLRADTSAAEGAFRRALQLDGRNAEARNRLRAIGRQP